MYKRNRCLGTLARRFTYFLHSPQDRAAEEQVFSTLKDILPFPPWSSLSSQLHLFLGYDYEKRPTPSVFYLFSFGIPLISKRFFAFRPACFQEISPPTTTIAWTFPVMPGTLY